MDRAPALPDRVRYRLYTVFVGLLGDREVLPSRVNLQLVLHLIRLLLMAAYYCHDAYTRKKVSYK